MSRTTLPTLLISGLLAMNATVDADDFQLKLRTQSRSTSESSQFERTVTTATWSAKQTAVIVCDVWDKHHSLNAVRRMEEFLPRMNDVLNEARQRGATVIHSPSDCMAAYEHHPARQRAIDAPAAKNQPADVEFWCSKIPAEELAAYPIDQSDGGDDDAPDEHAKWAAELKALGRNPGLPWMAQSELIDIDEDQDFISDRGDEVWNILESRGIDNVILVGVHTNMCVLGRPFGLRQMARNGKNVVLMRDLTDCMYNPKSWPFVDHFTGNDLIVSHIERFVCPTITSDQILGGQPFVSRYDTRTTRDLMAVDARPQDLASFGKQWTTMTAGSSWKDATNGAISNYKGPAWYRCTIRVPSSWLKDGDLKLTFVDGSSGPQAWLNGTPFQTSADSAVLTISRDAVTPDDINLLVVRFEDKISQAISPSAPTLSSQDHAIGLHGRWQFRIGEDPSWSNIPLPAKFGIGSDVLFEP